MFISKASPSSSRDELEWDIPSDIPSEISSDIPSDIVLPIAPPDDFDAFNTTERIIGGAPVTIDRFPWQISLRFQNRHICGGSILSARNGLTAAHCLDIRQAAAVYSALVGTNNRLNTADGFATPLARFTLHPQWHRPTIQNDVAVIQFVQALPLSQRIRPISLPAQNAPVPHGASAVVSGW